MGKVAGSTVRFDCGGGGCTFFAGGGLYMRAPWCLVRGLWGVFLDRYFCSPFVYALSMFQEVQDFCFRWEAMP